MQQIRLFTVFFPSFPPCVCACASVSLVLGIPTVKRQKQSYLVSTLNSLLYDLSPSEREDTVIIVFVAEVTCSHTLIEAHGHT